MTEIPSEQAPSNNESAESPSSALNTFANDTAEKIAVDMATKVNDPKYAQEVLNKRASFFPKHMQTVADQLSATLDATDWDARMDTAFEKQKVMKGQLKAIRKKLGLTALKSEEKALTSHPYLAKHSLLVEGWNKMTLPEFHITREIYQDIDFLKQAAEIPGITAEQKNILLQLQGSLEQYAANDAGRQAKEMITRKLKNNFTDRAINQMARMTFGLAFGAATVAAGTIGAVHMFTNGKKSNGSELIPALGFAGLTLFVANPGFAQSIIGGVKQRALDELKKSVNTSEFKVSAKKYGMQGPIGHNVAMVMHDSSPKIADSVDKCAAGIATPEEKEFLVKTVLPAKATPQERDTMNAFWNDPMAVAAIGTIRRITDPDAFGVAVDFLTLGMGKFYQKAKNEEATIKAHLGPEEILPA